MAVGIIPLMSSYGDGTTREEPSAVAGTIPCLGPWIVGLERVGLPSFRCCLLTVAVMVPHAPDALTPAMITCEFGCEPESTHSC